MVAVCNSLWWMVWSRWDFMDWCCHLFLVHFFKQQNLLHATHRSHGTPRIYWRAGCTMYVTKIYSKQKFDSTTDEECTSYDVYRKHNVSIESDDGFSWRYYSLTDTTSANEDEGCCGCVVDMNGGGDERWRREGLLLGIASWMFTWSAKEVWVVRVRWGVDRA